MAKAGKVAANRRSITISLDRDFLERIAARDRHFASVLAAFDGANEGDWGGPDFPEYDISDRDAEAFARLLAGLSFT